jgi:hypothetical protein
MGTYATDVVLQTQPNNLIGYWQLNETSGSTAVDSSGNTGRNGTYNTITLDAADSPHGTDRRVPLFNGDTSNVDIYSSGFDGAFDPEEGSISAWIKASDSLWEDDDDVEFIINLRSDADNLIHIESPNTDNRLYFVHIAGGSTKSYSHDFSSGALDEWFHVAMVFSKSGDYIKGYIDGTEIFSITYDSRTWSGSLHSNRTVIGCRQVISANNGWEGNIGDVAIWDTPLSASEIEDLATIYPSEGTSPGDTVIEGKLEIRGQADAPQLEVIGNSSQTFPLQKWENSAEDVLAQVTADGRLQIGSFDNGEMATDDALIEAHRADDATSLPTRGLNMLGEITGTLSNIVQWAVQELVLKGTGGISALHSALRVTLTNQNTGTMSGGADLRAGDFEAINEGGSSGQEVPELTGVHVSVSNASGAYLDTAYGLKVEMSDDGTQSEAFAIHAEGGVFHLGLDGEVLELPVTTSTPANPPDDHVRFYVELNSGVPELFIKKSDGSRYKVALTLVT